MTMANAAWRFLKCTLKSSRRSEAKSNECINILVTELLLKGCALVCKLVFVRHSIGGYKSSFFHVHF